MNVEVQLTLTSQPIIYDKAVSTYTKGDLFCVLFKGKDGLQVHKYPLNTIFRVTEDYE
jgi:hypothetical protein